jgi:hypothetical protein
MIRTRRVGARSLGALLAGVVALALYVPMSSAVAKVAPHRVVPAACACSITVTPQSGIKGSVASVDGSGFPASSTVNLAFVDAAGVRTVLAPHRTGPLGGFHATITIPSAAALGHGAVIASDGPGIHARAGFLVTRNCTTTAAITVTPSSARRGASVTVNGSGFCANTRVRIRLRDAHLDWATLAMSVLVDGQGKFSSTDTIPTTAAVGDGYVAVHDAASGQSAKKPFTVKS